MKTLFLSRRNLEVLLSKLDRVKAGETSACTLVKYVTPDDPEEFMQACDFMVTAVEDEDYYHNRPAGAMLPIDEPPNRHKTGSN